MLSCKFDVIVTVSECFIEFSIFLILISLLLQILQKTTCCFSYINDETMATAICELYFRLD